MGATSSTAAEQPAATPIPASTEAPTLPPVAEEALTPALPPIAEEAPAVQVPKTLVIHNLTKRPITYWAGEECGILAYDETFGPLQMPVYIFPAKVTVRPSSTPRFHVEDDLMYCDNIENTNTETGHYRCTSATVAFTVESFPDYYKATVRPSVVMA